jgi:hypothetical protein
MYTGPAMVGRPSEQADLKVLYQTIVRLSCALPEDVPSLLKAPYQTVSSEHARTTQCRDHRQPVQSTIGDLNSRIACSSRVAFPSEP